MFRNTKLSRVQNFLRYHNQQFHTRSKNVAIRQIPFVKLGLATGLIGFTVYDGFVNDFTYCGAALRFLRSMKTAALIAVDYLMLEGHESDENYEELLKAVHKSSAIRLMQTCLLNGGLYIKVGQGVAAINHILPVEYTSTLALLQDKCLPTSRGDIQKVFLEDFGKYPEEIFKEFDYEPIAAASLAQVFRAKLKTGETVAVKVQYSDLKKRFTSDLGTIIFIQNIVELFFKSYNFGWILRNVQKNLVQELNFINEGKNSEHCAKDLEKFKYVYVPPIHWDYTGQRCLTMDWVDGFKISDMKKIKENKMDIRDIDIKLFHMFAEQIFNTGFVHADPHPGNIFLRRHPITKEPNLILLDHGLYEHLPEDVRLPLCEFWEATVLRDEAKMEAAAKKVGIKDYMKFAEVLLQQPIRLHGGHIKTKLTDSDIEYMQKLAKQNFELIMSTLREMPRNLLFIIRNLNTIRAISRHHGDVVDRPRIMARYAQRCVYNNYNSVFGYFNWLCRRIQFEYCLWSTSFRISCLNLYLKILYKLGRAPESAKTIMSDLVNME